MNKIWFGVLTVVFVIAGIATAQGSIQYQVTAISNGLVPVVPTAINIGGLVVGYSSTNPIQAVRYADGTWNNVGTLGGSWSTANGINASGQIAGSSDVGGDTSHAFLYSGEVMQDLGTLGGTCSWANAINSGGQVVGQSYRSGGTDGYAFLYYGGVMQDLGSLGGTSPFYWGVSRANAINDAGQAAGDSATRDGKGRAFLYDGEVMHDLGSLGGGYSSGNDINAAGHVTGGSTVAAGGPWHAFLYSDSSMHDLGTLLDGGSIAFAMNDSDQVVGWSWSSDGLQYNGFLYSDGTMHDLNDLIDPLSGWHIVEPRAINDNGWIAATATDADGMWRVVLLTPTPEPSTLALVGIGLLTALTYRCRRRKV